MPTRITASDSGRKIRLELFVVEMDNQFCLLPSPGWNVLGVCVCVCVCGGGGGGGGKM